MFSLRTFTRGSPMKPSERALGVARRRSARTCASVDAARLGDARDLEPRGRRADVRVEAAAGGGDGVGREHGVGGEAVLLAEGSRAAMPRTTRRVESRVVSTLEQLALVGPRFEPLEAAAS